jgi:hypothetical protein
MPIINNSSNHLNLDNLIVTPRSRYRPIKQRPAYYKTECIDCDIIISVKWEWKYVGTLPTRRRPQKKTACPFCDGTHIKTIRINEPEYIEINQQWDIVDLADSEPDNPNDCDSWIVRNT